MLLKKSTVALCSSGSLSSTFSLPAPITPPSNGLTPTTPGPSTPASPHTSFRPIAKKNNYIPTRWQFTRSYAAVHSDSPRDHDPSALPDSSLPAWPKTAHPTPYEIFDQAKSAPYSKKTFYSLVKLYHPDRHAHILTPLSHAAKLERYRLVVAANTILSDPAKRRAYDLYGAGWGAAGDMSNTGWREADRAWRREPGSAAGNATWEDWERWHERQGGGPGGKKQEPLYMSNGMFVVALAAFVVVGGWGQATRAGSHSVQLIEMRETSSQSISEDMWRRRQEKAILSREDRVESFLRQREGWGHGPGDESPMPKD